MKKLYIILIVVLVVSIIVTYSIYYYIVNNIDYKFTGFGLSAETVGQFTDKVELTVDLTNRSNLSFSMTNFNLKVKNSQGNTVGSIETIRSIKVPAHGSNKLIVEVRNIDEAQLVSDALAGDIPNYRIIVSGLLGGFLPIRYSADAI